MAVVTRPFEMEGSKRGMMAGHGISELTKSVDSLITIPNQKLLTVLGPTTTLLDAFKAANQVLQGAVQGIAELITRPGLINVDFADVRTVMSETGMAMMGSRARRAVKGAPAPRPRRPFPPRCLRTSACPARTESSSTSPRALILSIGEFEEVGRIVKEFASEDATVVVGTVIDPEMSNELRVTVVATGLGSNVVARSSAAANREHLIAATREPARAQMPQIRVVKHGPMTHSDYAGLDKPTVQRQRAVGDGLRHEPRCRPRTCWTSRHSCVARPTSHAYQTLARHDVGAA